MLTSVLVAGGFVTPVLAADGASTPATSVIANDTAGMRLALTAHSGRSADAHPSCRPQDANMRCWGSLVLDAPDGLSVRGLEVHRVAVGDTGCGDDGDDGCGGHETSVRTDAQDPVRAAVRGVATLRGPGSTGLPAGSRIQVFIDVEDGPDSGSDRAQVRVRPFVEGPSTPDWSYESGWKHVRQVRILMRQAG